MIEPMNEVKAGDDLWSTTLTVKNRSLARASRSEFDTSTRVALRS